MTNLTNALIATALCLCPSFAYAQPTAKQENANTDDKPVSFQNKIQPIIVEKCGKCHVSSSKGKYGIASYQALMESDSIVAHDPDGSHFIEVIESGEMPKGGLQVSDAELAALKSWIAQGAKFDGADKANVFSVPDANRVRQRGNQGNGGGRLQAVEANPQAVGDQGVAWYVTWETALAEAKRSNRPIFFMSAAAQCSGVSGVF